MGLEGEPGHPSSRTGRVSVARRNAEWRQGMSAWPCPQIAPSLLHSGHMKLIEEFKAFAMRGNVIDLALAVIIGTAFGKIVSSLVEDIIMPPIGFLIGGISFSELAVSLETGIGAPVLIKYGMFIQALFDFVIIAFVLFLALKGLNKLQKEKADAPTDSPKKSAELAVLEEIRDSLKK